MTTLDRLPEHFARTVDRRRFLQRTAMTIFGFVAASAATGFRPPPALAAECAYTDSHCQCIPLNGNYCSNCNGANCPGPCDPYFGACPAGPNFQCWCTLSCCYNCSNPNASYCGHYKCCDCSCPTQYCTCRAFTYDCRTARVNGVLSPPCCS